MLIIVSYYLYTYKYFVFCFASYNLYKYVVREHLSVTFVVRQLPKVRNHWSKGINDKTPYPREYLCIRGPRMDFLSSSRMFFK